MNTFSVSRSLLVLLLFLMFLSCKKEKEDTIISKTFTDSIFKNPQIEKKEAENRGIGREAKILIDLI